jgi:hypothetical protein
MKMTRGASRLPSLARTLQAAGYTTSFTYGGDINFTNMKGYLLATGFQHLTADTDFSRAERLGKSRLFLSLFLARKREQEFRGRQPLKQGDKQAAESGADINGVAVMIGGVICSAACRGGSRQAFCS